MIRITARINGFRRAGVAHYGTQEYPDGHFTPEQLDALKAEPMLIVEEQPDESPAEAEPETPAEAEADAAPEPVTDAPAAKATGKKAKGK